MNPLGWLYRSTQPTPPSSHTIHIVVVTSPSRKKQKMGDEMQTPHLIKSFAAFSAVVDFLVKNNEAVVFYNANKEFKIVLRNDPIMEGDGGSCGLEVGILIDEATKNPIALETNGWDDDDAFIIESAVFQQDVLSVDTTACEALGGIVNAVNTLYDWTICRICAEHFVKRNDHDLCIYCRMTSKAGDLDATFCAVCQESGSKMLFERLPCCGNQLHKHCWKKCVGKCPLCRSSTAGSVSSVGDDSM